MELNLFAFHEFSHGQKDKKGQATFSMSFTMNFVVGIFFSRGSSWDLQWVVRHMGLQLDEPTRRKFIDLRQMYENFKGFEGEETGSSNRLCLNV